MDQALAPAIASLLQYGVLGAFTVILLIYTQGAIRRERERGDAAEAEVRRLNALAQDKTIPALVSATQAIAQAQAVLQTIQYQRELEANVAKRLEGR